MKSVQTNISILFLGTQMEIAGAQRMLLSQAHWFQKRGYAVQTVFFYDKQGLGETWQKSNPFPVISLEAREITSNSISNAMRLLRAFWRLFRLLRNNTNVIITFTPHSNLLGLPLAWLAGVPVRIGTHHGYIEGSSKAVAWLHGRLSNSWICSRMVAVSAQVKGFAINHEGVNAKRIVVIENGIEPINPAADRNAIRKKLLVELNITDDYLLILTVGRLTMQKGHAYLLNAIARMAPQRLHVHFIFAGDGPLRSELENKARNLGIAKRITFLGVRNDVSELLLASDIFVQPSLWEGLSLALLEALMAGLPVLATEVEGVVDVVDDEKSALLVPAKDSEKLAVALERLTVDANLRSRLSKDGRERAEKNYSIDTMCSSYEKLIQQSACSLKRKI